MRPSEILGNVLAAIAVAMLGFICHVIIRAYRKFDRFMLEHVWLIATTLWTRQKVIEVMAALGIDYPDPPPADLKKGRHRDT